MIAIIDYGVGNLGSVKNALDYLNVSSQITSDPAKILSSDGVILPGVGSAGDGMKNLKARKLDQVIRELTKANKPLLGICLGMQLLFEGSEEGSVECLGILKGEVKKFKTGLKVPQIGWNEVRFPINSKLRPKNGYYYFIHSYYCDPKDKTVKTGFSNYDGQFVSYLEKNNLFATQFHPEKSGQAGLVLLKSFAEVRL